MTLELIVTEGPEAGRRKPAIDKGGIIVGRSTRCDFIISQDLRASRVHCVVEKVDGKWRVRDLQSSHGTCVNGNPTKVCDLNDGDVIRIGSSAITVQLQSSAETDEPKLSHDEPEPAPEPQMAEEPVDDTDAFAIPGYRVESVLSVTRKSVFLVEDLVEGSQLVIRILLPGSGYKAEDLARLAANSQAATQLVHTNIARTFGLDAYKGTYYSLTEYAEGIASDKLLASQNSSPTLARDVVAIGIQAANALECAHAAGIFHGTVQPSMIIVQGNGAAGFHVKLTGFDTSNLLYRTVLRDIRRNSTDSGFIAPEQALNPDIVTGLTDQFALAATMYCLLTGTSPYSDLSSPSQYQPSFSQIISKLHAPQLLVDTISRALQPTPSMRFANITAFRSALEAVPPNLI